MPKKIDWMYFRKNCNTCKKAHAFMAESLDVKVPEADQTEDATKVKYGNEEALELLAGVDKLVAAKGKKVDIIDIKKNRPEDEVLLGLLMGPTGNLRAPTMRVGKTLLVGFNEEAYQQVLA